MQKFPTHLLKDWFLENRRSLPWRENVSPYAVWISEVMLQQTQVVVVIPYFERWMELFPTVQDLALAPIETVLKAWEGLGYYQRARNLHLAAKQIVEQYGGELPSTEEELALIKGIGSYTQGAIRSFAFKQKAAALDGNAIRVLTRFFAYEEEVDKPVAKKYLHGVAEHLLPDDEPWLISEGLIELGATICSKSPRCLACPLKQECLANQKGVQDLLPKKRGRPQTTFLERDVAVIQCERHFLVAKVEGGKLMEGLYEFPYMEKGEASVLKRFEDTLSLKLKYIKPLNRQHHTFTRFRAQLFPHLMETTARSENALWLEQEELIKLPFSSGHRKILESLVYENFTY